MTFCYQLSHSILNSFDVLPIPGLKGVLNTPDIKISDVADPRP